MAALEMRRRVLEYNREAGPAVSLGIHIGIDTGAVVSGEIRGPVVREFHVLGDAVNTAARINSRKPTGEIWVGRSVHDALGDSLAALALPPLTLKGKSQPVEVFALDAPRHSGVSDRLVLDAPPSTGLVGREAQRQALEAHLWKLREGIGGCVGLVGEVGAGKSRLLAALGESENIRDALCRLEVRLRTMARAKPVLIALEDAQWIDPEAAFVLDRLRSWTTDAPILVLIVEQSDPDLVPEKWIPS